MGPAWLVPIVVSILVTLWKVPKIRRSSNKEGHLLDLSAYVGVAFLLYYLLFWMGGEVAKLITGITFGPITHVCTIIAFLICYVLVLFATERSVKKACPVEIETLVEGMDRMYALIQNTESSYEELNGRVEQVESDVANRMDEAAEKIAGAVERQRIESKDLKEKVTSKINEHRNESVRIHTRLGKWEEEMKKVAENQRKNIEALREEVKSFRGAKAKMEGHKWENAIADRVKKLGFDVLIGRAGGQPDVIVKNGKGNVVGVVGCKSYALRSRRGMSDMFNPEIKFARKHGVPLAVSIHNKLNDLEFFEIYNPGELDNFQCSAPTWLAGETASDRDRKKQAKCRREFLKFIGNIS